MINRRVSIIIAMANWLWCEYAKDTCGRSSKASQQTPKGASEPCGICAMAIKSTLLKVLLGVFIGFLASYYREELDLVKNEVIRLCRKRLSANNPGIEIADSGKTTVKQKRSGKTARLFTKDELWEYYRGEEGSRGLHLAIMGRVYDVKKGVKHYGPGGGYSFFAGRDGTKAFSTGEFNDEGLTDDLSGVDASHFGEYENWVKFFDKEYQFVGKLIGNFYDANGDATLALKEAREKIKESQKLKEAAEEHNKKFPHCNSEWTQATGSRVWCTMKSGGIDRDWVGVPRQLKMVGENRAYCVCIRNTGPPTLGHTNENTDRGDLDYPYLKEYEGCDSNSYSCKVKRNT